MTTKNSDQPKIKCVVYARVARNDEDALQLQIDMATAAAAKRGLNVIAVFSDIGSGNACAAERPGLVGVLKAIDDGAATALFVRDLDRIARNYGAFKEVGGRLKQCGATLHVQTLDVPIDPTDPVDQLLFGFGNYEREMIRERTLQGIRRRYTKETEASG